MWGHFTPGVDVTSGMRGAFNPIVGSHAQSQYVAGQTIPPTGNGSYTLNYTYPASGQGADRPHAVTNLSDGSSFGYDANGNMIRRYDVSPQPATWCHTFDAENRLTIVAKLTTASSLTTACEGTPATSSTTTYMYDGNGSRVKRIVSEGGTTTTTIYVAGTEIELVNGTESERTIYYPMGGAFRIIGGSQEGLYYRHGDHLGSISVLTNSSGQKVTGSEVVYAPFGEIRTGAQPTLTDFGYTGQVVDRSTDGLMYYGARYYLPELRRFISTDTIVTQYLRAHGRARDLEVRHIVIRRYEEAITRPLIRDGQYDAALRHCPLLYRIGGPYNNA